MCIFFVFNKSSFDKCRLPTYIDWGRHLVYRKDTFKIVFSKLKFSFCFPIRLKKHFICFEFMC